MMPLSTERLLLRNWDENDRELFFRINSDDTVMEFFPFRRNREEADRLFDTIRASIDKTGFGFAAIELTETGECIGFAGLSTIVDTPPLPDGAIEIGWRLAPEYWGKGYVTEAAQAWLAHGFADPGLTEIISFAVEDNHRSIAVMKRLGMEPRQGGRFMHPRVPGTFAHLRPHVVYQITRQQWLDRQQKRISV